jgi:hypothetical protein
MLPRFCAQLSKTGVSDNVDAVKVFLSTLQRALVKERHFALVDAVCFANHRLAS